jgi:hypothetical protein
MVFLAVGTVWFQGYIYSEPVADVYWRAPAAGTVVTLVLVLWGFLDYRTGGSYPTWMAFNPKVVNDYQELWVVKAGKKIHCRRERNSAGRFEYKDDSKKPMPTRVEAIIVEEAGKEVHFDAEVDKQTGKFKAEQGQWLRYIDPESGRVMTEDAVGEIATFRWGLFLGYTLLNVIHLLAWFGCLWLLLQYQWSHALGLAVVFWLVTSLLVMPGIIKSVDDELQKQPATQAGAVMARVAIWVAAPSRRLLDPYDFSVPRSPGCARTAAISPHVITSSGT